MLVSSCLLLVATTVVTAQEAPYYVPLRKIPSAWETSQQNKDYAKIAQYYKSLTSDDAQPQMDFSNTMYVGKVALGVPPQTITVIMDTGSTDLWVVDEVVNKSNLIKFDVAKSASFVNRGGNWTAQYGSGASSGYIGQDVACITPTEFCFEEQVFGVATKVSEQFADPVNGICGLAYPPLSAVKNASLWYNIIHSAHPPPQPFFTVWLDELKGTPNGATGGSITFGDYDTLHCAADGDWVPLSAQLWFEFNIDGVSVVGYQSPKATAISDTGTSFIAGPPKEIEKLAAQVGAVWNDKIQGYSVTCEEKGLLPPINIHINGKIYSVQQHNYMVTYDGGETCQLALLGLSMANPQWILGDPFIRQYCNAYDMLNHRVGLFRALW